MDEGRGQASREPINPDLEWTLRQYIKDQKDKINKLEKENDALKQKLSESEKRVEIIIEDESKTEMRRIKLDQENKVLKEKIETLNLKITGLNIMNKDFAKELEMRKKGHISKHMALGKICEELDKLYFYANELIPKDIVHSLGHKKELLKQVIEEAINQL